VGGSLVDGLVLAIVRILYYGKFSLTAQMACSVPRYCEVQGLSEQEKMR
jgi:hypothetical protein